MSLLNTASYESQIQNFAQELQSVDQVRDAAFNAKDRANEILKTIGEAKMFLSGKPVTNYLITKGKGALQSAIDKAGVKLDELKAKIGDSAADAESGATEGQVGPAIRAVDEPATGETSAIDVSAEGTFGGETPLASVGIEGEEIALNTLGAHGMANTFQGVETPNPAFDSNLPSQAETALTEPGSGEPPSDLDLLSPADEQSLFRAPSSQPLEAETAETAKVAQVEKTDLGVEKALATEGKAVGEGAGEGAGAEAGEETGTEATAGVLDAIPGADIIGLLIGGAVTIAALAKKPHEHLPVDKINASFQAGIQ